MIRGIAPGRRLAADYTGAAARHQMCLRFVVAQNRLNRYGSCLARHGSSRDASTGRAAGNELDWRQSIPAGLALRTPRMSMYDLDAERDQAIGATQVFNG